MGNRNSGGGIMRYLIILVLLFVCTNCYAFTVTDDQFEALDTISIELVKKCPGFTGFIGTQDDMHALGCTDAEAKVELDKIDVEKLKEKDPKRKELKKVRKKLKGLGLDDEDLAAMGLKNDIPD